MLLIQVYEQSRFLNEVGAAIHLAPNAARVLQRLGFDPARANAVQNAWVRRPGSEVMNISL